MGNSGKRGHKRMYKAAIFDLDGTVADTIASIAVACNKTLEDCGYAPILTEQYKYFAGDGADTLVERILLAAGDSGLVHFKKAYESYQAFFEKDCTYQVSVFPGMREALDRMKRDKIKLAVLTNKPHERAVQVLDYLFGEHYFDRVLGAGAGYPKKPDPAGALMIAEEFGAKPGECLYVGDTNVDMQTGRNAGMFTVGVLWGFRSKEELEQNHAQALVQRPKELTELIEKQFPG